ncbi:MAG: sorbosone dehydrogenase family protein, partial [Chthoniobacterales bacterium]
MRFVLVPLALLGAAADAQTLTGKAPVSGDWTQDAPGVSRQITVDDLPPPFATDSVDNGPSEIRPPAGAQPRVPPGFK